jgi:hypothetical protein
LCGLNNRIGGKEQFINRFTNHRLPRYPVQMQRSVRHRTLIKLIQVPFRVGQIDPIEALRLR